MKYLWKLELFLADLYTNLVLRHHSQAGGMLYNNRIGDLAYIAAYVQYIFNYCRR